MNDYPQLTEMGIRHPEQIKKFLVNGIATYDVLRIIYSRSKGSLLPHSRTYEFPRIQKTVTAQSGKPETVMETNPGLRLALSELQALLEAKEYKQDVAESILEELRLLEDDIAMRSGGIKELLKRI